jgi:hypothetical protein
MKATIKAIAFASLVILGFLTPLFAQAPAQQEQPEFVKQGQQLMREGSLKRRWRFIARLSRLHRILLPPTSRLEAYST